MVTCKTYTSVVCVCVYVCVFLPIHGDMQDVHQGVYGVRFSVNTW